MEIEISYKHFIYHVLYRNYAVILGDGEYVIAAGNRFGSIYVLGKRKFPALYESLIAFQTPFTTRLTISSIDGAELVINVDNKHTIASSEYRLRENTYLLPTQTELLTTTVIL